MGVIAMRLYARNWKRLGLLEDWYGGNVRRQVNHEAHWSVRRQCFADEGLLFRRNSHEEGRNHEKVDDASGGHTGR